MALKAVQEILMTLPPEEAAEILEHLETDHPRKAGGAMPGMPAIRVKGPVAVAPVPFVS